MQLAAKTGIPHPNAAANRLTTWPTWPRRSNAPLVIKPRSSSGGRGTLRNLAPTDDVAQNGIQVACPTSVFDVGGGGRSGVPGRPEVRFCGGTDGTARGHSGVSAYFVQPRSWRHFQLATVFRPRCTPGTRGEPGSLLGRGSPDGAAASSRFPGRRTRTYRGSCAVRNVGSAKFGNPAVVHGRLRPGQRSFPCSAGRTCSMVRNAFSC